MTFKVNRLSVCLLVRPPRPQSLSIIGWWCSNTRTAAKKGSRLCPSFYLLCFMSMMVPVPPYPPSKIHPGYLHSSAFCPYPLPSFLLPPLRPFLCSRPSTSISVWSPVVRPSEVYNPPADCRSNALLLVSCTASCMRVCTPTPDLCGWWYLDWVWVEGRRRRRFLRWS